jgi:hypothetical protein
MELICCFVVRLEVVIAQMGVGFYETNGVALVSILPHHRGHLLQPNVLLVTRAAFLDIRIGYA